MDRKKFLFRQRIFNIVVFMAIFTVIFGLFGIIMYNRSSGSLFEEVDSEYAFASEYMRNSDESSIENYLAGRNIVYSGEGSYIISHKIFLLMRGEDGELLNKDALSSFDYILNISFDGRDIGQPRTEQVTRHGQSVYYRTYSVPVSTADGQRYHIQMITNVTEIMESLNTIQRVLSQGTAIILLCSIAASWFLSQFLVSSVTRTWEQQDEFLSYAAHLLRAPLTVIHNSIELVLQQPSASVINVSAHLLHAVEESSRLRKITSRLMSMAVLQAPGLDLQKDTFLLDELIMSFVEAFKYSAEAGDKSFRVELQEGVEITGDKELIRELCILLLENALKYTNPGDSICIAARRINRQVSIEVEDTGIGISEEALPKIFTRFYREESVKKAKEGSGLGLYIASLIAQQHGGSIKASHNKPKGMRFCVYIPCKYSADL